MSEHSDKYEINDLRNEVDRLRIELNNLRKEYSRSLVNESKITFISETALRLIEPFTEDELFSYITDRIYSISAGSIVTFSEFDLFNNKVIVRVVRASDLEREKIKALLGRDPEGLSFDFPDQIRKNVKPGDLNLLSNGFYDLVFGQMDPDFCLEFEKMLNIKKVFAMVCSVHSDILGTVALMTHEDQEPENKIIIESVVRQGALALKRRRIEILHAQSQEKFSTAFYLNPQPMVISLENGTILEANDAFLNEFERTRDEVLGKSSLTLNMFGDPDARNKLLSVMQENSRVNDLEVNIKRKNGEIRTAIVSAEKLRFHNEKAFITVLHDITERKNMTEALRRSEEKYRQVVELANSIILRWDMDGNISFLNNYGLCFFGYSREEIIGKNVRILLPDEKTMSLVDMIAADPEKYGHNENENIRKDGQIAWIRWANQAIRDEDGNVKEILAIGYDITGRKKAEEALRMEHDILDAAISNVDFGFLVTDTEGNIILYNEPAFRILGIEEESSMNANHFPDYLMLEYTDGTPLPDESWPIRRALSSEYFRNLEVRLVNRRDMTSKMISINSIPVHDQSGKLKLIVFSIDDFTEIFERTEALKESQQRYDSLFNNATIAIQHCKITTDMDGRPVDYEMFNINNTLTAITGITREYVTGKKATEIFPGIENDPNDFIGKFGRVALEGTEISEDVYFKPIGKWLSMYAYSPTVGEFTVFFSDITERKNAEMELKLAKEKAEESDRLKSAFLANMSHEIRTPMNGILGFADLLRNPNLSGESQKMYIEAINSSGKRMLSIINDLIDISKIESGQIEVRKSNTNLPRLMHEVISFFKPEADKAGINLKLSIDFQYSDFFIETDKVKLYQVLSNLIKNALKFTRRGGEIEVGCRLTDNASLFFFVKDTGIGIREELRDKIFERFMQGDSAEEHEGVGLGLAISKAYVELLGGQIGLETEHGKGSIFFFTLPFEGQSLPFNPASNSSVSVERNFQGKTILIAEDDEMSFFLLKEILKDMNVNIIRAENGAEAVRIVKEQPDISLVLMDLKLPVLDGIEATREIKKINPGLPVIIQSAYAGQSEIDRSFLAGSDDYITKPVDSRKVMSKILELIH